jgi:hypothetical protein
MNTLIPTLIYLFDTFLLFTLCIAVVIHYWSDGIFFKAKKWQSYDWLIVGILVSFIGKILDGLYWQITWTSVLLNFPIKQLLLDYGTLANIPLRQLPIFLACVCHLKAAWMVSDNSEHRNRFWNVIITSTIYGSALFSIGYMIVMFFD